MDVLALPSPCYTPSVATPSPTPTPTADPLALLASLYLSPFLIRLASLPRAVGWRLELSEDDGGTWTSLSPVYGYQTPQEAIQAGAQAISDWQSSRVEATSNEIAYYFLNGKLERRKITILDEDLQPLEVDGYIALNDENKPFEHTDPLEAIRMSKERPKVVKPSGAKR